MEHCLILVIFYRNIIKDEPSDEESPVTVEDNLIINYGNNQALGNWKFICGGRKGLFKMLKYQKQSQMGTSYIQCIKV